MKARVKFIEGMAMMAESGSGHGVVVDGSPDVGGRNLGPRPMEMLLMGMGACSTIDVITILRKARQPVQDCWVELDAERAEDHPRVFTRIVVRFVVVGRGLSEAHVERAIRLSSEKYCSATLMLGRTAAIEHSYEIRESGL